MGVAGAATLGYSVATDASGNVYVAGWTTGGLDGNPSTGGVDSFVAKYNSSGVKQYTRQFGEAGASTWGNSVATDASGNVYVAGKTQTNGIWTIDSFFTKFDSSGIAQYTRKLGALSVDTSGGDDPGRGTTVATDTSGNVYVAGATYSVLDGNALTGTTDFFVTKYDASGARQFARQLGVAGADTVGWSVATDATGNVYVAGRTSGGLDGNTLTGTQDFFVTKYSSSGVKQ
jgi:hypothetical protein